MQRLLTVADQADDEEEEPEYGELSEDLDFARNRDDRTPSPTELKRSFIPDSPDTVITQTRPRLTSAQRSRSTIQSNDSFYTTYDSK